MTQLKSIQGLAGIEIFSDLTRAMTISLSYPLALALEPQHLPSLVFPPIKLHPYRKHPDVHFEPENQSSRCLTPLT